MSAWWLSWYHDPDDGAFEYHGPWWRSGYDSEGGPIIVAAVPAETEDAAWDMVQAMYDLPPEDIERRFCDPIQEYGQEITPEAPWTGAEGRFPRAEWMRWPDVQVGKA